MLGISLARDNRSARPRRYRNGLAQPLSTVTSRSMALTGLVVLAFVAYHLAHFTFGAVLPEAHALVDAQGRHDVYGMVVAGFRNPWIAGSYVLVAAVITGAAWPLLPAFGPKVPLGVMPSPVWWSVPDLLRSMALPPLPLKLLRLIRSSSEGV